MAYIPSEIEPQWQAHWAKHNTFITKEDPSKPKYYVLDMFPYPSASGLHVGHASGYTATDIVARYYRMKDYNVLHPMGWDAFGLPAEQHAIETGEHPSKLTYRNILNYKATLQRLGISYDWSRELYTCDPSYYKWTQWIFNILYEKGLAYQAEVAVNWCPGLKTVLANDEVIDGKSERGSHPVQRVPMRQWMLKITDYAERLLADLDSLDWPESVKEIQRNWIGKSSGARIKFKINGHDDEIEVFTTRPDTLFGATYMVLAPEHPLISKIASAAQLKKLESYRDESSRKSDFDRTELNKNKSGEFTGAYCIHPLTGKNIPIWISDYVLMSYGTGAIMSVPGHDERDHAFALKFDLPIIQVISNAEFTKNIAECAYSGDGILINSNFLNGLDVAAAKQKMGEHLQENNLGQLSINYKFRDWLFSRQRYWGEPFPLLKDANGKILRSLTADELPVTLPEVTGYEPTADGKSPLANATTWVQVEQPDGTIAFRETDTMPGAAGSSWYFLRFCDPLNAQQAFSPEKLKFWMPVDLYVGGQEHAVGHLLFSRFWTKVLFDAGHCPVHEPFKKLVNQGMVCRNGAKMSKSKGNGVNPDLVINQFGADSVRIYEMFMSPLTQTKEWDESNLGGILRFLTRIEKHLLDENGNSLVNDLPATRQDLRILHKTIKKLTEDIEALAFNTSVSQMMIFLNAVADSGCRNFEVMKQFIIILSPFAPHLAEHLWHKCILKEKQSPNDAQYPFVSLATWPQYDSALVTDDEATIGVQVNGKHRGEITIARNADQKTAVDAAMNTPTVAAAMEGKEPRKIVYVANRILNFVM